MDNYLLYIDGECNEDYGVVLQGSLRFSAPQPKVTTISVPGRNGDLHIYDGSYKNVTARVGAYIADSNKQVKSLIPEINRWLCLDRGYVEMSTDDDPDHIYLARVKNGVEINARLRVLAPFEIVFDLKPQKYLASHYWDEVTLENGGTVYNPTQYTAYPRYLIRTSGGEGSLTIGDNTVYFVDMPAQFYYDAETQNAYLNDISYNSITSGINGLPCHAGTQAVAFDGGITSVKMRERYFEI